MKNHPISVNEARELVAKAKTVDVSSWLDYINGRIREAATKGQTILRDPISGTRMICDATQRAAIKQYYIDQGYKWEQDDKNCAISW